VANELVKDRFSSSYVVTYPDFPSFDVNPQNIQIFQEMGTHDIVELTYPRFGSFYIRALKTGTPIQIRFNTENYSGQWLGYVSDVKKNTNPSLAQPVVVRCVSTSMALKEGGSKIWTNKTATDIVTELSKKHKLKPIVTPHKTIFTQQSLSGHTAWEKVQELATRIGYSAHVIDTELHFHPLDVMLDKFMTVMPILSYIDDSMPPYSKVKDQTLDVFRATLGDYSEVQESRKKVKKVYGIDPLSGQFYSASSSANTVGKNLKEKVQEPLFEEVLSGAMSGSKEMAQVIADAHAQFSRFVHSANGSGQGDPRIAPYRTAEVKGVGEDIDGFWVIKKATHFLTFDGRYQVDFECMNDGRGANKSSVTRPSAAGTVPVRNLAQELATGAPSTPTYSKISAPTTLVNQTNSGFKVTPRRWVGI
jgi:phage protein D